VTSASLSVPQSIAPRQITRSFMPQLSYRTFIKLAPSVFSAPRCVPSA